MTSSIERVGTYALHQRTLGDASKVMADLADAQGQLSSGLKTRSYEGIASQTEQLLSLESKLSRADIYQSSNSLALTRINSTSAALDQVIDTATSIKNLIVQRRNGVTGVNLAFGQQLRSYWQALTSQLNSNLEGRYLFSGSSTDTPAVDDTTFPTLVTPGVADDGYYRGSKSDIALQADDNTSLTYNVRADDEGFQKIFAGLAMANSGDAAKSDDQLAQAFDFVSQGLTDIIATQATVNANKVTVEQINQRQQSLQVYWKGVKESIVNADMVGISTQVAINQGILQASFQAFAKINSLRLSDFLR